MINYCNSFIKTLHPILQNNLLPDQIGCRVAVVSEDVKTPPGHMLLVVTNWEIVTPTVGRK